MINIIYTAWNGTDFRSFLKANFLNVYRKFLWKTLYCEHPSLIAAYLLSDAKL